MAKHNNRNRRSQTPKVGGNLAMRKAMDELRRSSATEPYRDRTKFDRNDERRIMQAGNWDRFDA